jgi:formylglycine-generating enzyme required for sulfatase activity
LRVFLSYHTPDRAVALDLKRAVETALPGVDVFVDQTHLRHGYFWQPALFEAIARTDAFLILVSNQVGDWQKYEFYAAQDRKVKEERTFVLLPVIIADRRKGPAANLPGLTQLHWIESNTEPTAPDPLAKIVAALQSAEVAKPPEPWRTINPYRGLLALEEQDADFFFGRERETADILDRITAAPGRLIALVGNSGVGKSSLVQAGVIGALKRQRWPGGQRAWPPALKDSRAWAYLAMKPGEDPIDALASEFVGLRFPEPSAKSFDERRDWAELLGQGKARLKDLMEITDTHFRKTLSVIPPTCFFLYIDQGEELYARAPAAERKRFSEIIADGLAGGPQRLIVMTSQRADYYGELQANTAWSDLVELIDVKPLKADALALVLREPAGVLGVGFESDDLVNHVVRAAEDAPGALPLLADLFTDLWERMRERGDGVLRVSDRREIIQVGAALAKRADDFLAKHPGKVEAVKRLFTLRLAQVPRQGEPVRARWERAAKPATDPAADAEWALAEELAGPDWRLTVTGEKDGKSTAEVAHEILLKSWPTLQRWLEGERDFLIWRGELETRRKDHEQAGKRDDKTGKADMRKQRQALLMGLPLDTAKKWLTTRRGDIEAAEQAFIEASMRAERAAARTWLGVQAAVGVLMLGTIAGLLGIIFKDEINVVRFDYFTVRPYIAANLRYVLKPEAERALKPGETFRECAEGSKACPEMVVLPAGQFWMGSPDREGEDRERPRHKVRIAKPFAVGKFELTWDEWEACVAMRGCDGRPTSDQGFDRGRKPLINVSWEQAREYVVWLSRMTGKSYRLLTEAEWEYAARGVTSVDAPHPPYPWGDDPADLCTHANLADRSFRRGGYSGDIANCDDGQVVSAPVGSYPANAFGLHDMHGNVWEWVEDCLHDNYEGAPNEGSAWIEGGVCQYRVVRGGSWNNDPVNLRSADRDRGTTVNRGSSLGFRVARTLVTP